MRRNGLWNGQGTPEKCEGCLPDIMEENRDAWNIYHYSFDSMGFSMVGALQMCRIFRVSDVNECMMKIKRLHQEVSRLERRDEIMKPRGSSTGHGFDGGM